MGADTVFLSLPHRLWRLLPARARRFAFAAVGGWLAPRVVRPAPPGAGGVVVGGEFCRASGLGEGARLMRAALVDAGVPCLAIEAGLGPDGTPIGFAGLTTLDRVPPAAPLVLHVNAPSFPAALLRLPRAALRGRAIVGYWAWELSVLPRDWQVARDLVHEVWVPSRFTADAISPFYPGMVHVVPHPLAAVPMIEDQLGRASFGLPDDCVVVLVSFSLASGLARKNPQAAIVAFRAAFGARADRFLVLKAGQAGHAPADLAQLQAQVAGAPNIRIMTDTLTPARNRALIAAADIVLSLHRSEGFGLVLAEAMLLGRAVIATDYGGNTDFITPGCGVPVPYRLEPAIDPRGVYQVAGAVWAEADSDAAAAALRDLADDPARRAALGIAARAASIVHFSAAPLLSAVARLGRGA